MKTLMLLISTISIAGILNAQTWKTQIVRVSGDTRIKTIKMNPRTHIRIQTHSIGSDSTENNLTYEGDFISGTRDTIEFKLLKLNSYNKYSTGVVQRTSIPPKIWLKDSSTEQSIMRMALTDIDHIKYEQKNFLVKGLDNVMEPLIFASLFVMIVSPFINYNYKDMTFNSERYKYWALGSTLGITIGLAYASIMNSRPVQKQFQFNSAWPDKKANVWKFK